MQHLAVNETQPAKKLLHFGRAVANQREDGFDPVVFSRFRELPDEFLSSGESLVRSLPPGSDPDNDGRPDKPVPMVLNVHGGPWARDTWGFHNIVQFLANRGFAVMQVNFRGSTGYGLSFMKAGWRQWGRKMQDDITDAVKWAIDQGIADPERVGIYGGSYGGYAAMAGLNLTAVAVYEIPYSMDDAAVREAHEYSRALDALLAGGRYAEAAASFLAMTGMPASRYTPRTYELMNSPARGYDETMPQRSR